MEGGKLPLMTATLIKVSGETGGGGKAKKGGAAPHLSDFRPFVGK